MEQNRESGYKLKHLWSINLQQRRQEYTMEKDSLFNKWCQENWTAKFKRMKSEHVCIQYTKRNSKQIEDLNVRPETKNSEKKTQAEDSDINCSNIFLDLSPKAKERKAKILKLGPN